MSNCAPGDLISPERLFHLPFMLDGLASGLLILRQPQHVVRPVIAFIVGHIVPRALRGRQSKEHRKPEPRQRAGCEHEAHFPLVSPLGQQKSPGNATGAPVSVQ